MREYAILFRRFSVFACLDDKHEVKVGEPGFPVAAAERGRQVLVHSSTSFEVGDHDFTSSLPHQSASLWIFLMTLQGLGILGRCMWCLKTPHLSHRHPLDMAEKLLVSWEKGP